MAKLRISIYFITRNLSSVFVAIIQLLPIIILFIRMTLVVHITVLSNVKVKSDRLLLSNDNRFVVYFTILLHEVLLRAIRSLLFSTIAEKFSTTTAL